MLFNLADCAAALGRYLLGGRVNGLQKEFTVRGEFRLKPKPPLDTQHGKRKAALRDYLENLIRRIARVLHDIRVSLLGFADDRPRPIKDQRDQTVALLFAADKTKTIKRDRRTVIRDGNLTLFQV